MFIRFCGLNIFGVDILIVIVTFLELFSLLGLFSNYMGKVVMGMIFVVLVDYIYRFKVRGNSFFLFFGDKFELY